MENIIVKYSEFFEDDGGFKKVLSDFDTLGEQLVGKAQKYKKDINDAFATMNLSALKEGEKNIVGLSAEFKELNDLKKRFTDLEKQYSEAAKQSKRATDESTEAVKKRTREEVLLAREQQSRADAEIKKNGLLFSVYTRNQGALTSMIQKYRDLALKKELTSNLTNTEVKLMSTLEKQIGRLDGALKKVDAQTGRFTRNVGNYSSAYNGLSNSINQITRELPAFTFSAQTGILALSNNIPILTDEIGRLRKENRALISQGKPVKDIFSLILQSVLSLQTAMGVGILILTVYGDKIVEAVGNWFTGAKALKEQAEWLEKTNEFLEERGKVIQENINFERQMIAEIEESVNRTIRLRNAMGQNAQKNAIEERAINLAAVKNRKKFTDDEIELLERLEKERQTKYVAELKRLEDLKKSEFERAGLNESGKRIGLSIFNEDVDGLSPKELADRANNRIRDFKRSQFVAQELNKQYIEEAKKSKTQLIVLEDQYTKELQILQKQQETDRLIALKKLKEDGAVSAAELAKFRSQTIVSQNEEIFASDKYTAERRIQAQKDLVAEMKKLAGIEKTEALRALRAKYNEEVTEVKKNADGTIVTQKYVNDTLKALEYKFGQDKLLIIEEYNEQIRKATQKGEDLGLLFRLEAQKAYFETQRKLVSETSAEWENYQIQISKAQFLIEQLTDKPQSDFLGDQLETSRKQLVDYVDFVKKVEDQLGGRKFSDLKPAERAKVLREVEALEQEKNEIREKYETEEIENEIRKIDKLLEVETYGTQKYFELQTRKNNLLISLQEKLANKLLRSTKDTNKRIFDDFDNLVKQLIDKAIELSRKRQQEDERQVESSKDAVQRQQELAAAGLTNTLAFEQKQLAKREANLKREQKKEERLQKIKALYGAYSNYAQRGDNDALLKAIRDFGILEGIAASLGEGGALEDVLAARRAGNVPTNGRGIIRGQSHKGNLGGIPVLVEGKEGIFSAREMENLGKENFYRIKEAAGSGRIDKNFFSEQRRAFSQVFVHQAGNTELLTGLKDVKRAIENKPVQNWELNKIADGLLEYIETLQTPNKTVRNHYISKRKRL